MVPRTSVPAMLIRHEVTTDCAGIDEVNDLAFGRHDEANLIRKLRAAGEFDPRLSLVAIEHDVIVGHILFSPVHIEEVGQHHAALALAPMAVLPEHQRRGVGSSLVREGLAVCRSLGHGVVVVLGHAEYYPRFGFTRASGHGIRAPFDVPDSAFMVLGLTPAGLSRVRGTVQYPPAFKDI